MNGIPTDTSHHPVWSVYNELRTARLNVLYLQKRLSWLRFWDRWTEILIAIATTSSVGTFWFLQNSAGEYFWKSVGCFAVILSVIRPILKFSHHIQLNEKLLSRYSVLFHDIDCICIDIKHRQKYDNIVYKEFRKVLERKAELLKTNTDGGTNHQLLKKCEELVLTEFPHQSFYIPPS